MRSRYFYNVSMVSISRLKCRLESSVLCVGVISKVTNTQVSAINANESQLSLTTRHIVLAAATAPGYWMGILDQG